VLTSHLKGKKNGGGGGIRRKRGGVIGDNTLTVNFWGGEERIKACGGTLNRWGRETPVTTGKGSNRETLLPHHPPWKTKTGGGKMCSGPQGFLFRTTAHKGILRKP